MERWLPSTAAQLEVNAAQPHSVHSLARALVDALQHLVTLSGGWSSRPPHRRPAYDSADVRRLRRRLTLLHRLQRLLQPPAPPSPGCWPRPWLDILQQLHRLGISLLATTVPDLLSEALLASAACRRDLDALVRKMRRDRQARWRCTLADAWRERPGVVHHWLHAPRPQWGTSPIVNDAGWQCTSVSEVDATVRKFWVESVLRRHDPAEDGRCWARFMESAFYSHIPSMSWPSCPWDGDRVREALGQLRESSAPGRLGIPVAVWRSLPRLWTDAVARLLALIEQHGEWPTPWLDAYVVMIPKASGGYRPQDQRPITVLDLVYRIWSKGLVREWGPAIQRDLLGSAAMGFRMQSGPLHVAQLLSDLIVLRQRQRKPLYLASFDLEKCYDTIPWWAVFGVLQVSGAPPARVTALQYFYRHLRRCFRYGQVEGTWWTATNGFPQGCSLSPDLLNCLLESFHRWA